MFAHDGGEELILAKFAHDFASTGFVNGLFLYGKPETAVHGFIHADACASEVMGHA